MEYEYKAFISYNHNDRDTKVAETLHRMIETYIIPRKLRKNGVKKPGKVFRDEEELSASNDLSQHICHALDAAEYLIVICSPGAVTSKWVSQEISHFLEHHAPEKVLTVLTGGHPEEIYANLFPGLPEPLSLDLSGSTDAGLPRDLRTRFLKICAPLLGCNYDDLVMRDHKRRRQQLLFWMGGIALVAAVIISILLWSNHQIEGKNREILLRESELLTQDALDAFEDHNWGAAIQNVVNAMADENGLRPYYAPAEQLLFSILDPFSMGDVVMIPSNTILTHSSSIKQFCINDDGSMLTAIDHFGILRCFDTVTGETIWISHDLSDYTRLDPYLYTCSAWDSILVICDQIIFSVSQENGKIHWWLQYDGVRSQVELSDDTSCLAYLANEKPYSELQLNLISTETGALIQCYPLVSATASETFFPNNANTSFCDFSSDNNLFAGCYRTEHTDGVTDQVFFTLDLTTGIIKTVHKQPESSNPGSLCEVLFTDDDTTMTVVWEPDTYLTPACLDKFDIETQTHLWSANPGEGYAQSYYHNGLPIVLCTLYDDSCILLGYDSFIFALDAQTGNMISCEQFQADLIHLESIGDGFYGFILEDGSYYVGCLDPIYGQTIHFEFGKDGILFLEDTSYAKLFNGGFLYATRVDDCVYESHAGSQNDNYGFAASIPASNDHCIIVKRAIPCTPDLERKSIFIPDSEETLSGVLPEICGTDTFCIPVYFKENADSKSTFSRYVLFDRKEQELISSVHVPEEDFCSSARLSVLNDRIFLHCIHSKEFAIYDPSSQCYTIQIPLTEGVPFRDRGMSVTAEVLDYSSVRLADEDMILTVISTEYGLKLWKNDTALPDQPYPDGMICSNDQMDCRLLSSNPYGCLLVAFSENHGNNLHYYVFLVNSGKWYHLPDPGDASTITNTALGSSKMLFASVDDHGVLRGYNILSESLLFEQPFSISSNAIRSMGWILDDRFLYINSVYNELFILDGSTGAFVCQLNFEGLNIYHPNFACDPNQKRLYIWEEDGACLDMESWIILQDIPNMILYDPVSDTIFLKRGISADSPQNQFSSLRFPTTEELVTLGREFLGK